MEWKDAVRLAIGRHCRATKSDIFTRKGLIDSQLKKIIHDTVSKGKTPEQTLSKTLQQLRDADEIEFMDNHGNYCKTY